MESKPYLKHLLPAELAALEAHERQAKSLRADAAMHSKWAKQIVDRARARMKAKESAR